MQDGVAQRHPPCPHLRPRPDRDRVRRCVGGEHVEGFLSRDTDAAPLPDGEVVVAAVAPDPPAAGVEDAPLAIAQAAVVAEELALALAGEEAEVLALGPAGHRQAVLGGDRANAALLEGGEREAQ